MAIARPKRLHSAVLRRFSPLLIALVCLTAGYFLGRGGGSPSSSGVPRSGAAAEGGGKVNTGSGGRGGGSGGSSSSKGSSSSASDPGPAAVKSVCENTCTGFAKNGVCDEGRPNAKATLETQPDSAAIFEVQCDLGTDCDDCGPWVHTNTDASDSWRPIAEIREKKFEIYTRQSAHPTAYFMAFTDGQKDVDVSAHMWANRIFEPMYTYAWHTLLSAGCRGPGGERRLVVDVGANFGYYSLLAASMGCRVVAWEPVPFFAAYFKYGLLRNNLTNLVELRERIVSNSTGGELTIVVPNRGIWGTAGIDGSNIDGAIENEGEYDKVVRPVERVDEVVKEDVLIMKADVEGYEPGVLRGSKRLFLDHTVQHMFMEYSPGVAERAHNWYWFEDNPVVLLGLVQAGYTILHIAAASSGLAINWNSGGGLGKMEQVTADVLQYDIEDAWRLQQGTLGCIKDGDKLFADVRKNGVYMFGCGAIPEGWDPRSFRSSFGHNTNIFVFKGPTPPGVEIGGPASLAPPDYDVQHKYFVPTGVMGLGGRICTGQTPDTQVMHRCPCVKKDVCGPLEELVKKLAAEGKLPPYPVEGRTFDPEKMGIDSW
ncbi:A disintegrin and metallo ase with thrombospondin motifs 12 [Chlorella sorokiniana]|uniref:A disintegrin and metallo ase with thrombospondin motifs 12 n=1 Tax=Chlorella sorokiniana TaxID=3076 RepID=A0A2P6U243_CHLSO|nr:A disintegrin and metallo ase with thrombospondin motifs 12 [Chlorella sorokiniana]|eukprot:PRW60388.1 A disintegrin and metallo ase with thrombospondin motifs 12 [Chlorella sorokiniana]